MLLLSSLNSAGQSVGFQGAGRGSMGKEGKLEKTDRRMENSTVMFVQSTRRSALVNSLKSQEDELSRIYGFRIKYQEASGIQLGRMFSTDLARSIPCGRNTCWPCNTSKAKTCKARSVLYATSCLLCNPPKGATDEPGMSSLQEGALNSTSTVGGRVVADPSTHPKGRVGIYMRESSQSLHERAAEHVRGARSFHDKSHIIKHWMREHSDLIEIPPLNSEF
jgi:hypothetical protein